MKNIIFKRLFFALVMILGLASCEDRELITLENGAAPILMDLSKDNLILDENFPGNPALTVTWQAAEFNVPVEAKYSVEISSDQAFTNPYQIAQTSKSETTVSFTQLQMNEAAKRVGLVPYASQKLYFRVSSFVGTDDLQQYSNITSINITPYLASPTYDYVDLYLVGNATAGGWDNLATNGNLLPLLKTKDANVYTFTGLFKEGGFKVIKEKGSWAAQYGLGAAEGLLSTDGGSGDIKVLTEGYYKLTIDIAALTYTMEPVTAPTTTYNNVSIIGSVKGNWDTDVQLTKSTFDPHLWTIKNVVLGAGEFKFRANNAWDVSWGTNAEFFGVAVQGGANIPLSAEWTYDVYFNDATGAYTVIPVK
ncbi:hypothetical protein CO230_03515 [Chryseobacterium sp. 6424]|uniref:SusE domain-containing protein n=1 Tax=Chryseobacterium sp. 6424 TaxID=2039166 RepID=UPI000EFD5EA8|nr:SusE domain-containing protein [Chryseobacterium sp. 6424]AYO57274.1 hypothetical protein CO230_03515 [Chryseobacterium sp. 6424]